MNSRITMRSAMMLALVGMIAACTQQTDAPPAAPEQVVAPVAPQPVAAPTEPPQPPALTEAELEDQRIAQQVLEGLYMAAGYKLAVSETYQANGKWPQSKDEAGVNELDGPARLSINRGGSITVVYDAPEAVAGKAIVLVPRVENEHGIVEWTCSSTTMSPQYLPEDCK